MRLAGDVEAKNRYLLAPMAGVTDSSFRTICAQYGAGMTYTEMVSAKALVYQDKKTKNLLSVADDHRPCAAQIFGCEPDVMAEGARLALEHSHAELIDINMGCPVPKIAGNGEGSALMLNPKLASQIIQAVKKAVSVPVTVKFRKGYDGEHSNAVAFAHMAQESGADAIAVHGRTRIQMYSGPSDRACIRAVKQAVSVPVIASGDAFTAPLCMEILHDTGADFIMIARGAQGNPFIFRECLGLEQGHTWTPPTLEAIISALKDHARLACFRKGERQAVPELRKHALWYLGRLIGAKTYKVKMAQVCTLDEIEKLCDQLLSCGLKVKT